MKDSWRIGALLICMSAVAAAHSAEPVKLPVYYGLGSTLCGKTTESDFKARAPIGEWVMGYLSGFGGASVSMMMLAGKQSDMPDRMKYWSQENALSMAQVYCAANPSDPIYKAANDALNVIARSSIN